MSPNTEKLETSLKARILGDLPWFLVLFALFGMSVGLFVPLLVNGITGQDAIVIVIPIVLGGLVGIGEVKRFVAKKVPFPEALVEIVLRSLAGMALLLVPKSCLSASRDMTGWWCPALRWMLLISPVFIFLVLFGIRRLVLVRRKNTRYASSSIDQRELSGLTTRFVVTIARTLDRCKGYFLIGLAIEVVIGLIVSRSVMGAALLATSANVRLAILGLCLAIGVPGLLALFLFRIDTRDYRLELALGFSVGVAVTTLAWSNVSNVIVAVLAGLVSGMFLFAAYFKMALTLEDKLRHEYWRQQDEMSTILDRQVAKNKQLKAETRDLQHVLSMVYVEAPTKEQYNEWALSLRSALATDPDAYQCRLALASVLIKLKWFDEAQENVRYVLAGNPSDANALRIDSKLSGGSSSRVLIETFFKETGFTLNPSKGNSLIITSTKSHYREYGRIPVMLRQDNVVRESDMNDAISQIKNLFADWSTKDEGKEGLRGRIGIVVVASLAESANLVAAAAKSDSGLGIVVLSFAEIRRAVIEHNEDDMLDRQIKITTGDVNLYEIFTPATNPLDFYGRKTPIATITQLIDKGVPPGIFGLWRIGKTSLLHQLQQQETLPNHVVAYIDCQFWQGPVAGLAREIIEGLVGEIASRRNGQKLHKLATASAGEQDALVALRTDITAIYNELGYKVVVIFDEIEHAISERVKMKQDYEKLIRALLGLNSEKRIVVPVLCGKHPYQTALVSSQSTILSDFTQEFLKPMPKDECKIMIRSFGLRMGIEWDDEGLNRVYEATGGHPYVARYICAQVVRQGKAADQRRYSGPDVINVRDKYLRDPNNYLAKAWDIGIFTESEKQALQHLALGMIKTDNDLLGSPIATQRAIDSLIDYGIVIREHNSISIQGESYSSWIANSAKTSP